MHPTIEGLALVGKRPVNISQQRLSNNIDNIFYVGRANELS
jgi:hypothetical protein